MAKTDTNETTARSVEELEQLLAVKDAELAALKAAKETPAEAAPASAYREDPEKMAQLVTIRLPISGANKEPLYVRINDRSFAIKRGVDVSIPYYVWLHLQECQQADDAIALRMNDLAGKFSSAVEAYRLG